MSRKALGRGLNALFTQAAPLEHDLMDLDIDRIDPADVQPRGVFREDRLEELASSIRHNGIIQPLVVRRTGDRFQIIAGERRWRAAQKAGLHRVPCIVKEVSQDNVLELSLIENIQREELNPIEQANAYKNLLEKRDLTQEEVAERTGKDRATVANTLRLLKLEKTILDWMEEGKLTAGHGRALLSVAESQARLVMARRAARGALTVRQIERLAARRARRKEAAPEKPLDPNIRAAIEELQRALGTKVTLSPQRKGRPGRLIIEYYDEAHLQGLYERLVGK